MNTDNFLDFESVFFIGIGGVCMSGLAEYCRLAGKKVRGSDLLASDVTRGLQNKGVKIFYKHRARNVKHADLVVYTSAVAENNPELAYAAKKNIPVFKRSEFLAKICQNYKRVIAVSGSHGKTTATAMLIHIFAESGVSVTAFLGGEDKKYSNFIMGTGDTVIVEACEFRKNLLDLKPTAAAVLNIDNDHLDSYDGMDDMKDTFNRFIWSATAVLNADDANSQVLFSQTAVTVGIENSAAYKAAEIRKNKGKYSFNVYKYGILLGRITLDVQGKHNVYNALFATALADNHGISFKTIKTALKNFQGVKRRNEYLGEYCGARITADYAHHPKEIAAYLESVKTLKKDGLAVVFQPHTYSRTKNLMNEFTEVLSDVSTLIIYRTYAAREKFERGASAYALYERLLMKNGGKDIVYCDNLAQLKNETDRIARYKGVKNVVFMGAGDIYEGAKIIINGKSSEDN